MKVRSAKEFALVLTEGFGSGRDHHCEVQVSALRGAENHWCVEGKELPMEFGLTDFKRLFFCQTCD